MQLTEEEMIRSHNASEECFQKHNYTANPKEIACFFRCGRESAGTFTNGRPNITMEEANFEKSLKPNAKEDHGKLVTQLREVNAFCYKVHGFDTNADDESCGRFMLYNMCVDYYSAKLCDLRPVFWFWNYTPPSAAAPAVLPAGAPAGAPGLPAP